MNNILKTLVTLKLFLILTSYAFAYLCYGLYNLIKQIFRYWTKFGNNFVKHPLVWWFCTILIIGMGIGNLAKHLELESTVASAQIVATDNQDLQLKLKTALQRQSEIDTALKTLEDNLKNSNSEVIKVNSDESPKEVLKINIPDKWKAHIEYVSKKLKDDKTYQGAVTGYQKNQDTFGFYSKTECHPYILGAIHYREYGYTLKNGWNGQGMYQNLDNKYGRDTIVNNATEQTKQACKFLKGKAKSCQKYGVPDDLNNLDNIELIGCSLAKYNGCMSKHFNDCGYTVKGLSETQEDFMKCGADFTCPMVKEKQLGALTVIMSLILNNQ